MTESSETKGPAPMEGHGAYNRSSLVQAAGSSPAVPLLEKAAQQVSLPAAPEPVGIFDYCSAQGGEPLLSLSVGLWLFCDPIRRQRPDSVVRPQFPRDGFCAPFP